MFNGLENMFSFVLGKICAKKFSKIFRPDPQGDPLGRKFDVSI